MDKLVFKMRRKPEKKFKELYLEDQDFVNVTESDAVNLFKKRDYSDEIFDPIKAGLFVRHADKEIWESFVGDRTIKLNEARSLREDEFTNFEPNGFHPIAILRLQRGIDKLKNLNLNAKTTEFTETVEIVVDTKEQPMSPTKEPVPYNIQEEEQDGPWTCSNVKCSTKNHTSREGNICRVCGAKRPKRRIPTWKTMRFERGMFESIFRNEVKEEKKTETRFNFSKWLESIYPKVTSDYCDDYKTFMRWSRGKELTVQELLELNIGQLRKWRDGWIESGMEFKTESKLESTLESKLEPKMESKIMESKIMASKSIPLHPLLLPTLKSFLHERRRQWTEVIKGNNTFVKVYPDAVPREGYKYFLGKGKIPKKGKKSIISIVVPFYNEERSSLERTLLSLSEQMEFMLSMNDMVEFKILCVMDGWFRAHTTMKQYVKEMFGGERVYEFLDQLKNFDNSQSTIPHTTVVLQKEGLTEISKKDDVSVTLDVTMLIKADNRRKHNSHEWFFMTFANEMASTYAFATDCGTYYNEDLIHKLFKYMENNSKCVGITGRQRVMSYKKQEETFIKAEEERRKNFPNKNIPEPKESFADKFYRYAQMHDYEASLSCFMGGFCLAGLLPVLPGPCGLYRFSGGVLNDALKEYFDLVNSNPDQVSVTEGNLILAEDRILSATSVISQENQNKGFYTTWVNSAIFYFEAETDPEVLIKQRRRWINGTFFGYLWLYNNLYWFGHNHFLKKFLVSCQICTHLIVMISPAIFLTALNTTFNFWMNKESRFIGFVFEAIYAVVFVCFAWIHTKERYSFNRSMYVTYMFCNMILMVLLSFTFLWNILEKIINGDNMGIENIIVLVVMVFPWILGILYGLPTMKVTRNMIKSSLSFYLFLPTMVSTFAMYSFGRTWDLTWGNRPTTDVSYLQQSTPETRGKFKKKMRMDATANFVKLIGLNILVMLASVALDFNTKTQLEITIFACLLFIFPMIQMIFSFCNFFYSLFCCR